MPDSRSNVFTIPASQPFLAALIDALMAGRLVKGFSAKDDPLALASATLYLPTRRACRLARDVFLDRLPGNAAILPRIVPLGDLDEDEIVFAEAAHAGLANDILNLPDALGGLERTMPLAALILRWAASIAPREHDETPLVASNPLTAFMLAQDLARLLDDMTTRQVSWDRLDTLVPAEFDKYWQLTLQFLTFIRDQWPLILGDKNRIEPAVRRDLLIAAETARLARHKGPVIAAGSTGSLPSTALLLSTIATLPQGAVVLPGLDTDLDDAAWQTILSDSDAAHGHPQFALAALLARMGLARDSVQTIGVPQPYGREKLVSEALRPAIASDAWTTTLTNPEFAAHADSAMQTLTVIEAGNAEEEALAIAIALRETAEDTAKTAALVTPDVGLGRRVMALLARWNVQVDDSRGLSLADSAEGVFARLVADVALNGVAPVPLLALLKQGHAPFDPQAVTALERAILRGARPHHGTAGLEKALQKIRPEIGKLRRDEKSALHRSDPRRQLDDAALDKAAALVAHLKSALAPLETLPSQAQPIALIAQHHARTIEALDGLTPNLAQALSEIESAGVLEATPAEYIELFHACLAQRMLHRPPVDARVRIFGPLEARLQSVDRLVLGGLVEGVWPPETKGDPWLSRPMRHDLGLDLPERRIGLSAHDFAQALGAPDVILSRPAKLAGAPTVASRFVQRLAAVAGKDRWAAALQRGARYTALATRLDETPVTEPASRPAPTPPFAARPRQLSVTEIEDLLRDPYTIYARRVLALTPLDDVDTPPGAADRGTVIHNSIADYSEAYAARPPDNPLRAITDIGERHFRPLADYPEARAFWWPRFLRIAEWFTRFDAGRRTRARSIAIETSGAIRIPFGTDAFTLTVRADRIECMDDGRYAILDYKTGAPPTEPQVRTGLSPQLTLEAAILRRGGFKAIPAGSSVSELLYVRLRGGAEAGEEKRIDFREGGTADDHADRALARLQEVLARFADPDEPYLSLLHPMWTTHYGTYDHLARVQEWSLTGGAEGEGE